MPCHLCCDVCGCHCDCGSDDCGKHWSLESEAVKVDQPKRTRKVNEIQKLQRRQKLVTYKSYCVMVLIAVQVLNSLHAQVFF